MRFLEERCTFQVLTESVVKECIPFSCGDEDMDEFFQHDALKYTKYKMGKSYCFRLDADMKRVVACMTLSNDSIRLWDLGSSRKNAMWKEISNREKMLSRYPGVLIGRLAVSSSFAGQGIGSEILDFVKTWFASDENKTGCRLVIVDAKNQDEVLNFYRKNGFKFLFPQELDEDLYTKPPKDEQEKEERRLHPRKLKTRLMFFDLLSN